MLLRRIVIVCIALIAVIHLCAGEEERRNDDCHNRDRGRRRRGEERRARGQRRRQGEHRRVDRRRLIPSRRPPLEQNRPTYAPPENLLKPEDNLSKTHVSTHLNGNGHNNGYNSYSNGHVNGHHNNGHHGHANGNGYSNGNGYANGRPSYLCPAGFVRLGNACYLLSQHIATWQDSHFACRDLGSQLASLETPWEDETMRKYLNKNELARLERWIGGIFNWEQKRWIWGASGKRMSYQGFSRRSPNEDRQWHCVLMDPTRRYRWTHKSCIEQRHYICEAPLQRQMPPKDGNEI